MVPGPGARVVDVDVKETIGSGPRENIYDDSVVVAWELPTGFGAPELEIWGRPEGDWSRPSYW